MPQIAMPQKNHETPIGRRLFGTVASIIGGIYGGPAGAAAGGAIGGEVAKDGGGGGGGGGLGGMLGGLMGGGGAKAPAPAPTPVQGSGLDLSQQLQQPALGDSAFSRRMGSLTQNPEFGLNQGLEALREMPPEVRQQYTPTLIKARSMARGGGYG